MRHILVVLLLSVFGGAAFAASGPGKRKLVIGIEGKYFPDNFCGTMANHYDCRDGQTGIIRKGGTTGDVNGFDVRIAEEVCEGLAQLNVTCEYKIVSWDGIFERKDIDMIIAASSRVQSRIDSFGPTSIQYSTVAPIRFVAKECWASYDPEALAGKTLMVQVDTTYHAFLTKYYVPKGVNVIAVTDTQEIMDALANPNSNVEGALIGFNGLEAGWVLDHGLHVIKPARMVHPDFEPSTNASHVYFNRKRLGKKLPTYLDVVNATLGTLWANSVTGATANSIMGFEKAFERGYFNPQWQQVVENDCAALAL